jgi:hypothetical protein
MGQLFQVMHAPVISVTHLNETTLAKLSNDHNVFDLYRFVYDHGVFVFACDESVLLTRPDCEDIPPDLANCFRWAWGNGFEWIRFDTDGDVIADLPVLD